MRGAGCVRRGREGWGGMKDGGRKKKRNERHREKREGMLDKGEIMKMKRCK